jgi:hypothetical protein
MNELVLFRLFALFPFVGIAMPDLADWLNGSPASISPCHIIIDVTLALCLVICSLGIWLAENDEMKSGQIA